MAHAEQTEESTEIQAPLKVGLIIDAGEQSKEIYDLIAFAKASPHYTISHLIIQAGKDGNAPAKMKSRGLTGALASASLRIIETFEAKVLSYLPSFKGRFETYDLASEVDDILFVEANLSENGQTLCYNDDDLKQIAYAGFDFLIHLGGGTVSGEILRTPEFGVLCFQYGEESVHRDSPAGFWEIVNQQVCSGFRIKRLSDDPQGGDVLFKGLITTKPSYMLNKKRLAIKSIVFLHQLIEKTAKTGQRPPALPEQSAGYERSGTPGIPDLIRYLVMVSSMAARILLRTLLGRDFRWHVSTLYADDWRDVDLSQSQVIKNPPHRYFADPFVLKRNEEHFCFVEDFDFRTSKGSLSVLKITPDGSEFLGEIINEPFHLSYPFLIEQGNDLYMVPESHQANEIRLYKCVDFPLKWELEKVLIEDICAVDSNIFFKNGKWWMLTNVDSSDLKDCGAELHIYSSDDLLTGEWVPHPQNPVLFDAHKTRNGGILFEGNDVYRVYQIPGLFLYGGAFGVSRIERLTETDYSESHEFEVPANFFKRALGSHTYNQCEGMIVSDFVTIESKSR